MKVNQVTKPSTIGGLRGIILREESDTLVVQATPSDVKKFGAKAGQEVEVRGGSVSMDYETAKRFQHGEFHWRSMRPGMVLYDEHQHPIVQVRDFDVRVDHEHIDVTSFGQVTRSYALGASHRTTVTIRGEWRE
jgi:hypothetical protein